MDTLSFSPKILSFEIVAYPFAQAELSSRGPQ